jgi:hypothetical protein
VAASNQERENIMPNTYRAEFFTGADYARRAFEADTPQEALELARQFYDENLGELDFRTYDSIEPLDQIQIWDPEHGVLALWESPDYLVRQAAFELLNALEHAVAGLKTAQLFRVPSLDTDSYTIAALCDRAIARAKGGRQ